MSASALDQGSSDYLQILKHVMKSRKKEFGSRFTFEKMARACRIQRTYLSAVLNGRGHLNEDQVFAACDYLEMDSVDKEFVCLCHALSRSTHPKRQTELTRQIKQLQKKALSTDKHLSPKVAISQETTTNSEYHLDFNLQLVHILLTVERLAQSPAKIRQLLNLDETSFENILAKLSALGIIERKPKVRVLIEKVHLSSDSPYVQIYRSHMRLKALERISTRPKERPYSFSVLFSSKPTVQDKIVKKFLEFISWAQEISETPHPTDVFQMNFDFLKWTE